MEAIILKTETGYYVDHPGKAVLTVTQNLICATMYEKKDKKHLHRAIEKLRSYRVPYRKMIMELTEI